MNEIVTHVVPNEANLIYFLRLRDLFCCHAVQ